MSFERKKMLLRISKKWTRAATDRARIIITPFV